MRQVINIRFVAALAALVGLTLAVQAVFADEDEIQAVIEETTTPRSRRVDVIAKIGAIQLSPDFVIGEDGTTTGIADLELGQRRVMRVTAGTPGEISCRNLISPNRCVVLADVVGEAVLWFAIVPAGPRDTVVLGPIVDLQDGYAVFENGWEIPYPPVIERTCPGEDIPSFSDFLRRFGPNSSSIVDLETGEVVSVVCGTSPGRGTDAPVNSIL